MLKKLSVLFLFLSITVVGSLQSYGQCVLDTDWTLDPPIPPSGAYDAGTVIEMCVQVTNYQTDGANWLHGIELDIPPVWNASSLTVIDGPDACGGSNGNWLFYETLTCNGLNVGPGWFYDANTGGPQDGNPCNNWGDLCFGTNADWNFCFTLELDPTCGGPGNPFDGPISVPTIVVYGDGDTGSWGLNTTCAGGGDFDVPVLDVELNCCDAESGTPPADPVNICGNTSFDLFSLLGAPVDLGGTWTGPAGWTAPPAGTASPATFTPNTNPALSDPAGDYTYSTIGTDGCIQSSTITMQFIDLGLQSTNSLCTSTPELLNDLWLNPVIPLPPGGFWTFEDGTVIPGGTVDPSVNTSGVYTYTYIDAGGCPTTISMQLNIAPGGGAGFPSTTLDICVLDDPFFPWDSLLGVPASLSGDWLYYNSANTLVQAYLTGSPVSLEIDPTDYNGLGTDMVPGYMVYFSLDPACGFSQDTLFLNVGEDFDAGDFTTASICENGAPLPLESLLNGTPDSGGEWTDAGTGAVIPNPFDPSTVAANTTYTYIYSGGLAGTLCANTQILQLTVLSAVTDAGDPTTITVCETEPAFEMVDELLGTPQPGGTWTGPAPSTAVVGDFFTPGLGTPGTYTYTINSPCGSDSNTLTINVNSLADGGIDGPLDICPGDVNVPLVNGLGGTPDGGGFWTLNGNPVGATVNGASVNDGDIYVYNVGTGTCATTSEVTINLQPAPTAGTLTTAPQVYCSTDPAFSLNTLFTTNPSPLGDNWTDPFGNPVVGSTLNPASAVSGTYTYSATNTCGTVTNTISISIEPAPFAGTSTTFAYCENATAPQNLFTLLGGGVTTGGTWTGPSGAATGIFNNGDPAGVYTYTVLSSPSGACSSTATVTVSYTPVANAGTNTVLDVCDNETATIILFNELNGSPDGGGNWAPFSAYTPGVTPCGSTTTYTINNPGCPPSQATMSINCIPAPDAGNNTTDNLCESLGIIDLNSYLNGTPVGGGTWTNAITGAPVGNPFNLTGQCGTTLSFEYEVIAGACSNTSTLDLTVECPPNAGPDVTNDLCANNTALDLFTLLDPAADNTGSFTNTATGLPVPGNTVTQNAAASGSYTYTVTGTDCAADQAIYTLNIDPTIGVVIDTQCTPSQTTYVVTITVNGGSPPYNVSGIAGPPIVGNVFVSDPIPTGTPFSFTVSDAGSCPDFTQPTTFGPNCVCPADVDFLPTPQNICEGETADLGLVFPGGTGPFTIEYTDGTNIFTNVGPFVSGDVLSVTPSVTTNYTITSVSDINCTSTDNAVITVNVESAPDAGSDIALDYCGTGGVISLPGILDPSADSPGTFTSPLGANVVNVPQLAVASGIYTYTVSGTVCPDDQASYDIEIYEPLTVNAVSATCNPSQTSYVVTFEISGGDGNYNVSGITGTLNTTVTPALFTSDDIATGTPYSYTVSDGGPCADVVANNIPSPNCTCPATANFVDNQVDICEGGTASLELEFLSGTGPFTIDYTDGVNTFTNVGPFFTGDVLTVNPTTSTTYTLTSVSDVNCNTPVNDQILVNVEPQPNAGPDVTLDFCGTGGFIALSSVIDPSADQTGTFTGPLGNVVSNIPQQATSSGVYTYTVAGSQCPDDQAAYTIIIDAPISVNAVTATCNPSQTSYVVTFEISGGDGNYTVTGLTGTLNTTVSPALFTSVDIPTGTPYSYTVSDGGSCPDVSANNIPSPNCSCPATANFTDPSVDICVGSSANLTLNFPTGTGPFFIDYTDGTNTFTNVGPFNNGEVLSVTPAVTTTYTLSGVTDANCNTSASDQIVVNVEPIPNAGPDVDLDFCGTGGFISLSSVIDPSADQTGTFIDPLGNVVTNIPQQATSSGVYTYTVEGTECPDDQASYSINVDAPLSVDVVSALCDPSQTSYVVTIEISGGDGNYTVTGINGSLNTAVTPALFTSIDIPTGTPYSYTVSDGGPCPDVSAGPIASPNCACPAAAAFEDDVDICEGSSAAIVLDFPSGTGPFFIDYTDGTNSFTGVGPFNDGEVLTVTPAVTTTYTITGVEDANCNTSANSSATVNVEAAPNAGPDVTEEYCTTNGPLNLLNLVDGAVADLGGSFLDPLGSPVVGNTITLNSSSAGIYTYQVNGSACPADQALYDIVINDQITVTNVQAVCNQSQTGYIVSFDIEGGDGAYVVTPGGAYGGTITPGPTTSYESGLIPNGVNYSFTISDGSPCPDQFVQGVDPDCDCPAGGSVSGTTSICSGSSATLTFTFLGDGPWDAIVENSADPANPIILNDVDNGHIVTVTPLVTSTYTITSVNDANCNGFVSGSPVTITVNDPIIISNVVETCDNVNENYTVSFNISGGVPGTYQVSPAGGSIVGGLYTSAPIPSGEAYSFTVSDFGACPDVTVDGFFQCACLTEAGSIQPGLIEICEGEVLTVPFNNDDVLDGNDGYQFALHTGDETSIGDIIQLYNTNSITIPDETIFGETYYITGIAGNTDVFGNVDLNNDCTDQTNGIPVIFNALSSAALSGTGTVCPGEVVNLNIDLTGEGPWSIGYSIDNVPQAPITTNDENFVLTTTTPGTYALTSVTDVNCTGSVSGIVEVSNFATPTATLGGNPEVCENSGDGPTVSLTGQAPWTIFYSIGGVEVSNPITTFSDEITIPADEAGIYTITSLSDANCVGTSSGSLNVSIVPTPSATITGGGSVCAGDQAQFQVALTGEGPWNFTYTIGGVPQPSVNSAAPFYTFNSGTNGNYEITQVTDQNCVGSGTESDASLTVNPLPTAEIIASSDQICVGQELELIYDLQGTPPFNFTYVLDDDTITLENIQTDLIQVSQPTEPVFTEVLFIEDSSNPTCSNTLNSSKFIGVGTLPDAPVLTSDTICSYADSVNIGVVAAPGLDYSWSPATRLSDPNSSNPAFVLGADDFIPVVRTYSYILTASNGECSDSDTLTITVDPGPRANFSFSPNPVNSEDTKVRFTNRSSLGSDGFYFWQFDSLDTSQEVNPFYEFPGGVIADYTVSLLAIDPETGCIDEHTDVVKIRPEMLVYVPTAFTPDGDGLNDLWRPVMTNIDGDDYLLTVFDRNGQVVFQTRDATQAWNGSHTGGDYFLKSEVYIWKIETKNPISLEEEEFSGTVTLIR